MSKQSIHDRRALNRLVACALSLTLAGCLSDGTELIPPESIGNTAPQVEVGTGVDPIFSWNVGPIAVLTVMRRSDQTTPVWGVQTFSDAISPPVTHGQVPSGAQEVARVEPILTAGVEYVVRIERRSEGLIFTSFFTPPDGTVSIPPASLSASAGDALSLRIAEDGTVSAWGSGPSAPQSVTGLEDVVAVATGNAHNLAATADGKVWAWGANYAGQLGDGSLNDSATPVQVLGIDNVVAVAAGKAHSLALTADGMVWAWGENNHGQLGDGTTLNRLSPVQVPWLSDIAAIAAGESHTLAVTKDGGVWSWGANYAGQLGNGSTANASTPIQVTNRTE